jgi:uncharacterized protein (TIGR03435 family)
LSDEEPPKRPVLLAASILSLDLEASMSKLRCALIASLLVATSAALIAQDNPTFDVVSIKKNTQPIPPGPPVQRPDGGFSMQGVPIGTLVSRAYPPAVPIDMVGLPEWAMREYYDVSATSSLPAATPEQQQAMLRTMLADRCKLAAHFEKREQPVYDLVLARSDGKLGPNLQPSDVDCEAKAAADRATAEAARAAGTIPPPPSFPAMNGPAPPCSLRILMNSTEGGGTMEMFVRLLRPSAGRLVIDKTGLKGSYRISLPLNIMSTRGLQTPDDSAPSIFTALQEQLGLKLESSRAMRDVLVIDHIERPSEN